MRTTNCEVPINGHEFKQKGHNANITVLELKRVNNVNNQYINDEPVVKMILSL